MAQRSQSLVTDGSRTYKASVDACLPHARHVLDRFHHQGSVRGSPRCAATSSAASPTASSPPSTQRCSEPGSCCCGAATPSPAPTRPASTPSLTRTRGSKPAGRPYGAPRPLPRQRPPRRPGGPRTVLRPLSDRRAARVPRHRRHLHRMVRRDPGHHTDRASNGRIEGQTTCKSCGAPPTASPPSQLRSPRTADNMTRQPVPATLHPTLTAGPTDPSFDAIVISFRCVSSGSHMFVFSSHTRPANSETSPAALTTPALDRRSLRWFGISACTATPEDLPPSLAQHGSCRRSSTSSSLPFRTHVGAHNSVVGADQGFRAPSWDQESVHDAVHEDSASAPIATGQRPRPSFRHPQGTSTGRCRT